MIEETIDVEQILDARRLARAARPPRPEIVPGWEGAVGPFPSQYPRPHVYARDIRSGAGNCVSGSGLPDAVHVQAAPGVPVPEGMRQ